MENKLINLVLLKSPPYELPYVLDDAVYSVSGLLRRAGFQTAISFNVIDPGQINILFGLGMPGTAGFDEIRRVISPKNTLIFNTEQLGGESSWITNDYLGLLSDYVCLDYNNRNSKKLIEFNRNAKCFEFPLLPDLGFCSEYGSGYESSAIQHDLAFYGSSSLGNRMERIQDIANRGVNIKCFAGAFGHNLAPVISDCAAVLNIHGFSSGIFETIRCLRPAALGIPIISEVSAHAEIASWENSGVIFLPANGFAEAVAKTVRDGRLLLAAGRKLRAFVSDSRWPSVARSSLLAAISAMPK